LNETRRIARTFLDRGLGTIVFANSRLATEVLATYLKEDFARAPLGADVIRGYRGDYLSLERREIERGLREGRLLGVVATNALELGIGPPDQIAVRARLSYTFPLNMAEVVWGNGSATFRQVFHSTRRENLAEASFEYKVEAENWRWARLAVWDVAADGVLGNPVWRDRTY